MTTTTLSTPPDAFAIFDIGTNAARVGVYRVGTAGPPIFKDHVFTQLGRPHINQLLHPDAVDMTMTALAKFCQAIRKPDWHLIGVVAVATHVVRNAEDGQGFIDRLEKELDLHVEMIDGETEARLGAKGVLALMPGIHGVVADLGGGSLQLTHVSNGQIGTTISLPLGVQRISNTDPTIDRRRLVHDTLEQSLPEIFADAASLYVIGGSLRTFAELYLARAGEREPEIHSAHLQPDKVQSITNWLMDDPNALDDVTQSYSISTDRAMFLPAAGIVLSTLVEYLHAEKIIVSSAGIRDGLVQEVNAGTRKLSPAPQARGGSGTTRAPSSLAP